MPLRSLLLAALFSSALTLHAGPVFYAISFNGPEVSAVGVFGTLDPGSGAFTRIGPDTPADSHDLAISPSGQVYGIFGTSLYSIDKVTGGAALIGALPASIQSLAFRSDGALFGVDYSSLYSINPADGSGSLIGSLGLAVGLDNIRFDAAGNLYTMSAEPNSVLYRVDQTTGLATIIGASGTDDISLGAFWGGVFLGTNVTDVPRIVSVNPSTGAATLGAAATPADIYLFALDPTSVPEPGTVGLMGAGIAALIAGARRISRTAPSAASRD